MTELDLSSIEALGECDFLLDSSWHTDIYLDPETGKVYPFETINGTPERAYHNIDQFICRVGNRAVAKSVRDNILLMDERLKDILGLFIGAEWNGQNHVGKWRESRDHDWREPFHQCFREHISIKTYADPDSWFADQDLKALWMAGKSPREVVDSSKLDNGDECCHEGDAIEYVEELWAMWTEESR